MKQNKINRTLIFLLVSPTKFAVNDALEDVRKVLDVERNPRLAEDVDHQYHDKYELANRMTNMAIIAQMNCLQHFGLTPALIKDIDLSKTITLRFDASETCAFLKKKVVEQESVISKQQIKETKSSFPLGNSKKSTIEKFIKKVNEFYWQVNTRWEISLFSGTNEDKKIFLEGRDSSSVIVTQSDEAPLENKVQHEPIDLNLTWLLQQVDSKKGAAMFTIDTEKSKTPRRNEQVDNALSFFHNMEIWTLEVRQHFTGFLQKEVFEKNNPVIATESTNAVSISKAHSSSKIFIPIIPLLENLSDDKKTLSGEEKSKSSFFLPPEDPGRSGLSLSNKDLVKILKEQVRSMNDKIQEIMSIFPSRDQPKIFSVTEGILVLLCTHSEELTFHYHQTIEYIEQMLEKQLVNAIGKHVSTSDLDKFMRFHNTKFLNIPPKSFCHAIGRPNHYPFGILSIESKIEDNKKEPIETLVREIDSPVTLKVPLTAATTLDLTGRMYLHGWMNHCCGKSSHKAYELVAQARQFSSFLLVIGTMMGPDQLNPQEAIILQNKDEVIIPLLLNELPSVKEFRDAIQSLSPEQQQFAKAYRSMQLESSVFGVCVIQIKPQLEALLGLPEDSLAKEIKLTEDLMDLFVEYQIPSDLLSYDGTSSGTNARDKVENVREHVQAVLDVIDGIKGKQLENSTKAAGMAFATAVENSADNCFFGAGSLEEYGCVDPFGAPASAKLKSSAVTFGSKAAARPSPRFRSPAPIQSHSATKPIYAACSIPQSRVDDLPQDPGFSIDGSSDIITKPNASKVVHFENNGNTTSPVPSLNFASLPKALEGSIEKYDKDSALRSTTIKANDQWSRNRQKNLLAKYVNASLDSTDIKSEKNKAFDLLDALSRSGSLPIKYSDLHVVLCVTHRFEKDMMDTIIQDNINPIERLELSTLLVGSTVYGTATLEELVAMEKDKERLRSSFPQLLEN